MTPAIASLLDSVRAALGPKAVITDPAEIAPWLEDWRGRYHGAAPAILAPDSRDGVATIIALAHAARVPLVPQGGNTGMVGGATPPAEGSALILSLRRMNRIRSVSAADGLAVAEAGVILATLHEAAGAQSMRFPLTLGAYGSATIGGLCSTNAGGTQVLRFGTMRSLVAGVEAVLPDGSVHDGLAALKKDNRGYDLNQLLVGAEGTLGIITAATLRLVPAVAARAVAWVGLADPEAALALLRRLESGTDSIESFEIIPDETLALVLKHVPGLRAPLDSAQKWHVLVESVTDDPAAAESPAACEARFPGTRASGFGHLGDGNVHFHVRAPRGVEATRWYAEEGPVITRFVNDLVVASGGSISAEHGIGQMKLAELERLSSPARMAALRAIKAAFDPHVLMNPGKLVALAREPAAP
jgi:FAD/FMN-containing dehydrogenase